MRVEKDNWSIPKFELRVTCANCDSDIVLDMLDDFKTKPVIEGDMRETWEVTRLAFDCPLCEHRTALRGEQETMLPKAVVAWVRQNRQGR